MEGDSSRRLFTQLRGDMNAARAVGGGVIGGGSNEILVDISLMERQNQGKVGKERIVEHPLGGDFTENREDYTSRLFKFKDRFTKILDFQMRVKNITKEELEMFDNITVEVKTDFADEKTLVFGRKTFSALDDTRVFSIDEIEKTSEYFSDVESLRISDEYRKEPGITFTLKYLKVYLKPNANERMRRFKEKLESQFHYRLFTIKLGGFLGRFMDNVMSKLVFTTFLMSIFNFLAVQFRGTDFAFIGYVGVGIIVLVMIIIFFRELVISRKVQEKILEKEGISSKDKKTRKKEKTQDYMDIVPAHGTDEDVVVMD